MDKKQDTTKKQLIFQIYLPLIAFILLILVVGLLSILSTTQNFSLTAHWANISVVFLSVPFMIISLIFFAFLVLLVYAQFKLIRWIPIQLKRVYAFVLTVSAFVWRFSDKVAEPVIQVKSRNASIKQFFSIFSKE